MSEIGTKSTSEHRDSAVGALQSLKERLARMDFILPKDLELLNAKLHMEVAVREIEEYEKAMEAGGHKYDGHR